MGEIFERQIPADALPWTGERLTSGVSGQVEIEHLQRYAFARDICRDCDVLDIAAGEGYGSALLAQVARSVVGVELDITSVSHAKSTYSGDNLDFIQGDARAIPLNDKSVDVVVSFETIEHFYEHEQFISEIRRVLRPDGLLILSSPERDIYSPTHGATNPFHRRELTRQELMTLLESSFANVTLYAQRAFVGAAMIADGITQADSKTVERRSDTQFELSSGLSRAPYWVVVASNTVWSLPRAFLYIETPDLEVFYGKFRRVSVDLENCRRDLDLAATRGEEWRQQLVAVQSNTDVLTSRFFELGSQAEAWREALLDSNTAYLDLTRRFESLEQQAEEWRQNVLTYRDEIGVLQEKDRSAVLQERLSACEETAKETLRLMEERVAQARRDKLTVEQARVNEARCAEERFSQCEADFTAVSQAIAAASKVSNDQLLLELVDARAQTANLELLLQRIFSSNVWRVTKPLRAAAQRYPLLIRRLRRIINRQPEAVSPAVGTPFVASDSPNSLATSPEISPSPSATLDVQLSSEDDPSIGWVGANDQPAPTDQIKRADDKLDREPSIWFYLGDTFDWLAAHSQLAGVGRVTTDLFFSAIGQAGPGVVPCVEAPNPTGIASTSVWDTATYLSTRTGADDVRALLLEAPQSSRPPTIAATPAVGDHILFTGVVWTNHYTNLFRRLVDSDIKVSIFVYDIIPILDPEFVDEEYTAAFSAWLGLVLSLASFVFVSSSYNREQIVKWAMLQEIAVSAKIVVVEFGTNTRLADPAYAQKPCQPVRDVFVLSVGTIDRRKNQAMVCEIWLELLKNQDFVGRPQLVLVGSRDADTTAFGPAVEAAIANGDVLVLSDLADAQLAWLYQNCKLTCFPSLSEGFGLPVAESLCAGKVCIASDLPVIRDHAGTMPWYVPPGNREAMLRALQHGLADDTARTASEREIAETYVPRKWSHTWQNVLRSILLHPQNTIQPTSIRRPELPECLRLILLLLSV